MKRRSRRCPALGNTLPEYAFSQRQWNTPYSCSPFIPSEPRNGFMRGAIAAGLLATIGPKGLSSKEKLRLALQGGTAMATGIASANAIDRRDLGSVLFALAAGAAGLATIDYLLPNSQSSKEGSTNEQEKI